MNLQEENKFVCPMSYSQKQMWLLNKYENSASYNISRAYKLIGFLDISALQSSLNKLVSRHEILRTTFNIEDNQLVQIISESQKLSLCIKYINHDASIDDEISEFIRTCSAYSFDLEKGPLLNFNILGIANDINILIVTMHHIIADGFSLGIIFRELTSFYKLHISQSAYEFEEPAIQYADYSEWQRQNFSEQKLATLSAYWTHKLKNIPPLLSLPLDQTRPAIKNNLGNSFFFTIEKDTLSKIKSISSENNSSLFMTMITVFSVFLHRITNEDDIVIGTPVSTRDHKDLENLIGFFVNTLVVRIDTGSISNFKELLINTKKTILEAYEHRELPFNLLVDALQLEREIAYSPVFQVFFSYNNTTNAENVDFTDITLEPVPVKSATSIFDLSLFMDEKENTIECKWEYATALFKEESIIKLAENFLELLNAIVNDTSENIANLKIITNEENKIIQSFNNTEKYVEDKTIGELFAGQVLKSPNLIAIEFNDIKLTYSQLNKLAIKFRHHLQSYDISKGDAIGICMNRGIEPIIAILAVLDIGASYVPLDPIYPVERLASIVKSSNLEYIIFNYDSSFVELLNSRSIFFSLEDVLPQNEATYETAISATIDDVAYIMFTSGSTGKPKGIPMTHKSLVNLLIWQISQPSFKHGSRVLQYTSLGFDVSFQEIFSTWLSAGTLILIDDYTRKNPIDLLNFIEHNSINRIFAPNVVLQQLAACAHNEKIILPFVTEIITAGEQLKITDTIKFFFEYSCGNASLINQYGPTEAHVVTSYEIKGQVNEWPLFPSIGQPIYNTRIYVLDKHMQLVPINVPGEIYIAGTCLSNGYLDASLNGKFVTGYFNEILYKTGDKARLTWDGTLEYIGRDDSQIKINGYRVELEEIEKTLLQHYSVKSALVIIKNKNADKHIVAYIQSEEKNEDEIRKHLIRYLPGYMIPQEFFFLSDFPLTNNGKIDTPQLLSLESTNALVRNTREYVAPGNSIEAGLIQIWETIFTYSKKKIGIKDDFFELGGNSFKVIILLNMIYKHFEVKLSLQQLFNFKKLEEQAQLIIQSIKISYNNIQLIPVQEYYNLSSSQKRLWLIDQIVANTHSYNICDIYNFNEKIDFDIFIRTINKIIERHEILRTIFVEIVGVPKQKILEATSLSINVEIINNMQMEDSKEKIYKHKFKLDTWPLFKVALIKNELSDQLLFSMHHIISDGWSMQLFARDFSEIYQSELAGKPYSLPALTIQYKDYAHWQNNAIKSSEAQYWLSQLSGSLPDLRLPQDYYPLLETSAASYYILYIDENFKNDIELYLKKANVTFFPLFMACFKILLNCLTGETDLILGTSVANRNHDQILDLIGIFVNTLMIRNQLDINASFATFLNQVNETFINSLENQTLPFEDVLELIEYKKDYNSCPVSKIFFNNFNFNLKENDYLQNIIPRHGNENGIAKFELDCSFREYKNAISVNCVYRNDLFKSDTIELWMKEFLLIIKHVIANPLIKIKNIPIFE